MEQPRLPDSSLRTGLWLFIYMSCLCTWGSIHQRERWDFWGDGALPIPIPLGLAFSSTGERQGQMWRVLLPGRLEALSLCGDLGDKG